MKSKAYICGRLQKFINVAYPLGEDVISQLAEVAECRELSRTRRLCCEDERFDKVIFVSRGIFRLSKVMNGEDHTIAFGVEGDPYISLATYLYDEPSLFSYNPVVDSEIISIDNDAFKRLIRSGELVMWFNKVLLRQVHALENRYVWLGQQDAYTRYVRLMKLRPEIVSSVPLKYIASYLGVAKSTLSRIRARVAGK